MSPEGSDRQSRRDRGARHSGVPELGIETVAVFRRRPRRAPRGSPTRRLHRSAPPPRRYLNVPRIIGAADIAGADAVHPGYGFLAENARLRRDVPRLRARSSSGRARNDPADGRQDRGPRHHGSKPASRSCPAAPGASRIETGGARWPTEIGYPVLIKAAAGGGGRGMRIARDDDGARARLSPGAGARPKPRSATEPSTSRSTSSARGTSRSRSLGDQHGNVVHLGERDCSIQRRHQKLLEEAPRLHLDRRAPRRGWARPPVAPRRADRIRRTPARSSFSSTTDEQLLLHGDEHPHPGRASRDRDGDRHRPGAHQLDDRRRRAARDRAGRGPSRGHAIECRINAEDPDRTSCPRPACTAVPSAGRPRHSGRHRRRYRRTRSRPLRLAAREDHRARATRAQAIARMRTALDEFVVEGVETTIPLHRRLIQEPRFLAGRRPHPLRRGLARRGRDGPRRRRLIGITVLRPCLRRKKTDSTRLKREVLGILMAATGGFMLVALWPYDPAWSGRPRRSTASGCSGSYTAFYLYRALGFGAVRGTPLWWASGGAACSCGRGVAGAAALRRWPPRRRDPGVRSWGSARRGAGRRAHRGRPRRSARDGNLAAALVQVVGRSGGDPRVRRRARASRRGDLPRSRYRGGVEAGVAMGKSGSRRLRTRLG